MGELETIVKKKGRPVLTIREDCHILAARERHRQGTGIELS